MFGLDSSGLIRRLIRRLMVDLRIDRPPDLDGAQRAPNCEHDANNMSARALLQIQIQISQMIILVQMIQIQIQIPIQI